MDAIPILIFWSLAFWGFFSRRPVMIYLFFGSMSFGAFAVVPPTLTAGLTFTPTPMLALLVILRYLGNRRSIEEALALALRPSHLLLLTLFWLTAVITTIFMPRLFAGSVSIVPMQVTALSTDTNPLRPTLQNLSQLAYLTISVLTVFAFSRAMRTASMRQHALHALFYGGVLVIITGFVDFLTLYIPIKPLLEPFRTATYALLTEVELFGGKRVVGLMPEASSFGSLSLTFLVTLYFFRPAVVNQYLRERAIPVLLILLLVMVWLSTSSAAYVGLVIFFAVVAIHWYSNAFFVRRDLRIRSMFGGVFWTAAFSLAVIAVVILYMAHFLDPLVKMIDEMVFQKTSTSSFEERSLWTAISWKALLDTYGLGVGLGATRASNGFVAIISNTGVLGALFFYGFVLLSFLRRANRIDTVDALMLSAFRWSYLPGLVIGLLIGTSADFGTYSGFRFGLVMAIAISPATPRGSVTLTKALSRTNNARWNNV